MKASKMKTKNRSAARIAAKSIITGIDAIIRRSFFHHEIGSYCARRFSTLNDPRVRHRTERSRCRIRHDSTKVVDQSRRTIEYVAEYASWKK